MSNPLGRFKRVLFSAARATDAVGFTGLTMTTQASGYGIIVNSLVFDADSETAIRVRNTQIVTNNQTLVPNTNLTICDVDRTINTIIQTGIVFPANLPSDPFWKNRLFTAHDRSPNLPPIFVPPGHFFEVFHTALNAEFDCAMVFDELTAPPS